MFVALLVIGPPLFPDRRDFIIYGSYMMCEEQLPSAKWSWWSWVELDFVLKGNKHFRRDFKTEANCLWVCLRSKDFTFIFIFKAALAVVKTGSIQLWENLHPRSLSSTKPSSFLFYHSVTEVLSHLSPDLCVVSCASLDLDNQAACHHTSLTLTTVSLVWTAGYGNLLDFYGSNWLSGSNMWKEEVVLSSLRG